MTLVAPKPFMSKLFDKKLFSFINNFHVNAKDKDVINNKHKI